MYKHGSLAARRRRSLQSPFPSRVFIPPINRLKGVTEQEERDVKPLVLAVKSDTSETIPIHNLLLPSKKNEERALIEAKEAASLLKDSSLSDLLQEAASRSTTTRMAVMDAVADPEAVARIAKQTKLSERQVHEWTVEGLARAHRWSHLTEFAKRKSPIGYAPFVRACIRYGRRDEAEKYLAKATLYDDQIEANLLLGNFDEARSVAFSRRDEETLKRIQTTKNKKEDREIARIVARYRVRPTSYYNLLKYRMEMRLKDQKEVKKEVDSEM